MFIFTLKNEIHNSILPYSPSHGEGLQVNYVYKRW